jgi:hypothetical protein
MNAISPVQVYVLEAGSRLRSESTPESWLTWRNNRVSRSTLAAMERKGLLSVTRHPVMGWAVQITHDGAEALRAVSE